MDKNIRFVALLKGSTFITTVYRLFLKVLSGFDIRVEQKQEKITLFQLPAGVWK